jgi:UDP-N-acetylglucosamine 2-epimerase
VRVPRAPDIDLDVDPGPDAEELAEQRFAELLEVMPAACVLVERDSPQAMACAHAAAQARLPVAHMDGTRILFWNAARSPTRDKEFRCSVSTLAAGRT